MTKKFLLFIGALILTGASFGQLSGVKHIGSAGPNDYPTIALAIADLNLQGVGPGGVTFDIAAGYAETFPSPTAGTITATGSLANPIIFEKSGTGANPVIFAGIGTTINVDGIIKIAGGDYITFDGIDLAESAGNTNATTQMEWGYAMVKARNTFPVNGCQYITIRNCAISLNASNSASSGIYSGNHISTTTTPAAGGTVYTSSDYSNNCKFYNNTISNVFKGFNLNGYNDNLGGQTSFDQNTEIGIAGAGNTITQNVSNSNISYGVWANFQTNLKVAYNTITGYNVLGPMYGITPRTSNSVEIHHNTISASSAGSSGSYGIENNNGGATGYTSSIHHNLVQNSIHTGTGSFTAIQNQTANPSVLNIYSNTITGNTAVSGSMTLITFGGAGGTVNNIYGNLMYNNTKTGPGNLYCLANINYGNCNIYDNQIYSNNIATTGTVTAASTIIGIRAGQNGQTLETIYNNFIYDLNISGTTTAATNFIYGFDTDILSTAPRNWYNNVVRNLSISAPAGSGTVIGMRTSNGSTSNIYKNQVYNLHAGNAAGVVQGINIASGTQVNVYNNFISDLKTPVSGSTNAVQGITVAGGTNVGVYYNTVYLNASSTASTFGTSGIYKSGATTITNLRNNVIMNLSTPGSTSGYTVAYQWSGTYNASYYAAASNANNFYAGTPAANRLVFYDGINSDQTLSAYQARVSPKDALSFSENSPLVNPTSAPYDLHISTSVPTLCESGGVPVLSPAITDDIDGNSRSTTPDVGADEFGGMNIGVVNPTGFAPVVMSSRQINLPFQLNLSGNMVVIVWNTTGFFTTPSGTVPSLNSPFAGGTLLSAGTTSPVSHTGLIGGTTYYYKAFSFNGSVYSLGVPASATTSLAPPSPFNAYAMSASQIDLFWTKNVLNNDVIVAVNSTNTFGQPANGTAYSAGNVLPTAGTVLYVGPLTAFSHSGLIINTKYYYKAWSVDEFQWYSTTGSPSNATTLLCESTATLPFTENFDSYTPPAIGCGSIIDGNGDGTVWGSFTVSASTAHSGTKVLSLAPGTARADDWYFIRGLNLAEGQKYQLTFYYRAQYTYPESYFEVKWGTSPTPAGMFNPALFTIATPNNFTPYPSATCYITAPSTGTYYFGWHCTNNDNSNVYIDDISVIGNTCLSPPVMVTANAITATSADIGWIGGMPNVQIDYGAAGHAAGTGTLVSTSTNPQTLSSLTPLTTYDVYVRKDCGLASYSFWTGPMTFTTAFLPPVVTTGAATVMTGTVAGATLNGTVNANGVSTAVYFEYGLTMGYGLNATATPNPVTGTATSTISAVITGLVANGTTYHFRAVGFSGGVLTYGSDQTFVTTLVAPSVTTTAASSLTSTGATLNGTVNANNATTTVVFEYGLTAGYGSTATATQSPLAGSITTSVSAVITGLIPNTLYYFRLNGANAGGTSSGSNMTFTASDPPTVTTTGYTWTPGTTTGTVTLNAIVNANNSATTVTIQYGLTTTYGTIVNGVPGTLTGTSATNVTTAAITLSTTSLNNLFHYRAVAVNAGGTTYGSDMTFTTPIAPGVVTTTATTFPVTGVTLNGQVNANNANTTVSYDYGLTSAYGSNVVFPSNPVTGTSTSNRATIVTGLLPGTLYYFRVVAINSAGTSLGTNLTFTTPVLATATTLTATTVTSTGAKLNGTIVTNTTPAVSTNFRFDWGLTTAYGSTNTPTPGSGTTNATFSPVGTLTGLLPNTTYHYRVYATNATGNVYGSDMTFTTLAIAPTVITQAAFGITPTEATLNGTVNANGATTTITVEYGLTTAYGSTVIPGQSPVSGNSTTGVQVVLTSLMPNTLYYYRVTGVNIAGTVNGSDLAFTTLPLLPTVVTTALSTLTPAGATLNGTVNSNYASTAVTFEYGLTAGYGSTVSATPATVTGSTTTPVASAISALMTNTLYHYRAVGINTGGTSYGSDLTFTTTGAVPETLTVTGTVSSTTCFNATQTIRVAGTPDTFVVTPTGNVTMIAGQSINYLPWTLVQPGGYLHGYISTTNDYCGTMVAPIVAAMLGVEETQVTPAQSFFNVYPNPTTGAFTLDIKGELETGKARVEIYGMFGNNVFSSEVTGSGKHELTLSGKPVGMYVVRVISGNRAETARVIKQ